jgi:hypothetical protein|tara:strand:- start:265 stop:639 length:375 start_codon:yes stop_codon:yes gene_type:complete
MIQYFLLCIKAYSPLTAVCSKCDLETTFSGLMWIRTVKRKYFSYQYQCQDCGKLKYSDEFTSKGKIVALSEKCKCQGQYRRDKNIFCPGCQHRKTNNNQTEDYLTSTDNEIEHLGKIHDTENYQ